MKTELETNMNADTHSRASSTPRRRAGQALKAAVMALSVVAFGLSYQAASEAVAVYGILEQAQDALAQPPLTRPAAEHGALNLETITPVAG